MKYLICLFTLFLCSAAYCQVYKLSNFDLSLPFDYLPIEHVVDHSIYHSKSVRDSIFALVYKNPEEYIERAKWEHVDYIIIRVVDSKWNYLAHQRLISVNYLEHLRKHIVKTSNIQ